MRSTVLALAVAAIVAVTGCSAGGVASVDVPGGMCEDSVATAAHITDATARTAAMDQAIRTCRSLDQWEAAVATYGAAVVGTDASTYLGQRCTEATSGLGGYQLCGLLAVSLVTPKPDPTHKVKRKPRKTTKPKR